MRTRSRRGFVALTAVAGLLLAGCSGEGDGAEAPATDQTGTEQATEGEGTEAPATEGQAQGDPNADVEDGTYRGNGVVLPVPEGWTINQQAMAQGVVAAMNEDGTQQMTAQAIDAEQLEASGQDLGLDTLVDGIRSQIEQEAEVDEEVQLAGADQAHRLTYLEMPSQQEGQPASSATIVIANSEDGLIGEFSFTATTDQYDDALASRLVDEAGFDPDSEPPELPQQQPAPQPEQGGATEPEGGSTEE